MRETQNVLHRTLENLEKALTEVRICLSPLSFYEHLIAEMPTSQNLKFTNFVISILSVFSYQINYH